MEPYASQIYHIPDLQKSNAFFLGINNQDTFNTSLAGLLKSSKTKLTWTKMN